MLPTGSRATQQHVADQRVPASDKWALTWYFDTTYRGAPLAAVNGQAPCQDVNLKMQCPNNLDSALVLSYTEFVRQLVLDQDSCVKDRRAREDD